MEHAGCFQRKYKIWSKPREETLPSEFLIIRGVHLRISALTIVRNPWELFLYRVLVSFTQATLTVEIKKFQNGASTR